jgi:hypothetical protein
VGKPLGRVFALYPITGAERWSYDSKVPRDRGYGDFANRGVSTWKPANGGRRIYIATIDARLIALDAASGKPADGFGDNGVVNLRTGLRIPPRGFAGYEETSPPAIVGNTIVVGLGVADNGSVNQPSGEVRGFNAVTGKLQWTWHPIAGPKAPGAANMWSVIAADPGRGLVFLPTTSPSPITTAANARVTIYTPTPSWPCACTKQFNVTASLLDHACHGYRAYAPPEGPCCSGRVRSVSAAVTESRGALDHSRRQLTAWRRWRFRMRISATPYLRTTLLKTGNQGYKLEGLEGFDEADPRAVRASRRA